MNAILWIPLLLIGLVIALFCAILFLLGSPSPGEPGFLTARRFNMWAEMLGMLGYGLRHPGLLAQRATWAERRMRLPGDELVAQANACATYAITIEAPPHSIWPWLVQMGAGRALWYSWSPMHAFTEYKHHVSPFAIHPEWQNLKVGDVIMDGDALGQCNENRGAWRVMEIQDQRAIVFFSARDFIEGLEFDPQTVRPERIYGITSWTFWIQPDHENRSRLLIRVRVELGPARLRMLAWLVFGLGDAVFERTILAGIKQRVEQGSRAFAASFSRPRVIK